MKKILFLLLCALMLAGTAQADVVASWDMYGQPGNQEYTTGIGSTNIIAQNMVRGAGLNPASANNSMSSTGWAGTDSDDYFEFGFTVADGYSVTLDELWIGTRSSGTGPGTIGVYTSLDGYTTSIYTIVQDNTNYSNSIIDLSGLGAISGDFFIRLYEIGDTQADGDGATGSSGTFRIADHLASGTYTDVQFVGTVVPIPGALWLTGSGLLALVGLRRRMK